MRNSTDTTKAADPQSPKLRTALIIIALATGFVMASLDITIVNLAGPTIQSDLGASLTELTWIIDGYVLTFSSLLMLAGGLANRFGVRRIYLVGLVIFIIASALCAAASGPWMLIVARMLQGIGASLFMPSSMALLVNSFPDPQQRGKLLGLWSAMVAAASAIGPTLGGVLVDAFGWPAIFIVNLPVGVIGLILAIRYIATMPPRPQRVPVVGNILCVVLLSAVCLVLIECGRLGWGSPVVLLGLAIAIVSATAMAYNERRAIVGVMPWELFSNRKFSGANCVGFFFNFGIFGSLFVLSMYFQSERSMTAIEAGIAMLPMTIFMPFANIVYSRLVGRVSNSRLLTIFLFLATAGSIGLALSATASMPYLVVAIFGGIANIGAGIVSPSMTATLIDAAGPEHSAAAGASLNTNRQIGSLVGIAVMGTVLGGGYAMTQWAFAVAALAYGGALAAAHFGISRSQHEFKPLAANH